MEGTFRKTKRKANIRTSVKSIDDDDSNDEETM
jgi:hypothetical protein